MQTSICDVYIGRCDKCTRNIAEIANKNANPRHKRRREQSGGLSSLPGRAVAIQKSNRPQQMSQKPKFDNMGTPRPVGRGAQEAPRISYIDLAPDLSLVFK